MPGHWINGGAVAGTLDFYRVVVITDEERGPLYRAAHRWDYRRRNEQSVTDPIGYTSGWPFGGFFLDPANSTGCDEIFGDDNLSNVFAPWEPWRLGDKGYTRPYYIAGVVYDATNTPVAGASVESFITATDIKDGATVSGDDGTYQVPCYNRTAAHYVSAYKAGSPDVAGNSVNTLTPSV